MSQKHFDFWPTGLPRNITAPATNLFYNVEVAARRYPDKPYLIFFGAPLTYSRFKDEAERLAGYLQNDLQPADGGLLVRPWGGPPQRTRLFQTEYH